MRVNAPDDLLYVTDIVQASPSSSRHLLSCWRNSRKYPFMQRPLSESKRVVLSECTSDMRLQLTRGRLRQGMSVPDVDAAFLRANPSALQELRDKISPQLRAKVDALVQST